MERLSARESCSMWDICYADGLKFHAEKVTSDTIGIPTFYCIGNHDLLRGDEYGEETFEALFEIPWYSVDTKHVHFVILPAHTVTRNQDIQ